MLLLDKILECGANGSIEDMKGLLLKYEAASADDFDEAELTALVVVSRLLQAKIDEEVATNKKFELYGRLLRYENPDGTPKA